MIFKRKNRNGGTSSKQGDFVRMMSPQLIGGGEVGSLDMSSVSTHESLFGGSNGQSWDFKSNTSISSTEKAKSLSKEIWSGNDVDDVFSKDLSQGTFDPFNDPDENKTSFFNKNIEDDLRKISASYISDDDTGRDNDSSSPSSFFDNFFEQEERPGITDKVFDEAFGFGCRTPGNGKNHNNDSASFPYFQPKERNPVAATISPISHNLNNTSDTKPRHQSDGPTIIEPVPSGEEAPNDMLIGDNRETKVSDFLTTYFDKDTVHYAVHNLTSARHTKDTIMRPKDKLDFPCDENEFTFVREMSLITNGSGVKSFDESTCSEETEVTSNTDRRPGSVNDLSQQNSRDYPYAPTQNYSEIGKYPGGTTSDADASLAYSASIADNSFKQADNSIAHSATSNDDSSIFSGLISSESFRQKLMRLSHEESTNNTCAIENKRAKYLIHVVNNNDSSSVLDPYNNASAEELSCKSNKLSVSAPPPKEESSSLCPVDSIQSNFEAFTDMLLDKFQVSVI